ncbi:14691_t:CDS:2 [Funneliformis geosporum]|uniref:7521_t:CDS:1 n=1 Tax=Funneliformis geosporum TaxID=1117311 RepID=A0A9W4T2X1_9GLOM|nr:14691_t:CDS:2 [Funneliformis geosporum]CAI2189844.1 7521_t:CDS:2 [Funneliformis geosporum]
MDSQKPMVLENLDYYYNMFLNLLKFIGALFTVMKVLEMCNYMIRIKEEITKMNETVKEKIDILGERHETLKEKIDILGERHEALKERITTGFELTNANFRLLNEKWSFFKENVESKFGISKEKYE